MGVDQKGLILDAMVIRSDAAGDGHFGAKRGRRTHKGVDYVCKPGEFVYSPVSGVVSKLGYPYADNLRWRYVEIKDDDKNRHRLFYCRPAVVKSQIVSKGEVVAEADDVTERYPDQGMTAHVHYEIITAFGEYIDPEEFWHEV